MTSEINLQSVQIEQLLAPIGVGMSTGSPSLPNIPGSLSYDLSTNNLYIGGGSGWSTLPNGATQFNATVTFGVTGQPSFTGNMTIQAFTSGTGTSAVRMKMISVDINQSVIGTTGATWSTPGGLVAGVFGPLQPPATSYAALFPAVILISSVPTAAFWSINSSGGISFTYGSAATFTINQLSGVYV